MWPFSDGLMKRVKSCQEREQLRKIWEREIERTWVEGEHKRKRDRKLKRGILRGRSYRERSRSRNIFVGDLRRE